MGYYVMVEPNVKYYVEDLNPEGKKTILFIHGWPGSHKLFEYQFNVLPGMGYRCIGIDTRGFGDSDKPYWGYNFDRLADDVKCIVDELKLCDFTLLGHSNGGAISCRYMGRHKGYGVSKLILAAAAAPSLIKRPNFPYGADPEFIEQMIEDSYNDRPKMLRDFGDRFFFQHISQPFSDWFFNIGLQAAGWSTASMAKAWLKEVLFHDLSSIRVPTLIIHGIHDLIVPYELGEVQNQYIKNSKLVPFEFSGHAAFYDEKDRFNDVVTCFIEGR